MRKNLLFIILAIASSTTATAGWNIGMMCVKADSIQISKIIPDIFEKTEVNMWFEDASSSRMGSDLGVGFYNGWILIIDVRGRFLNDEEFPLQISKQYQVKTFWIAEQLIYREYSNAVLQLEIKGIEAGKKYLQSRGIVPRDEWGETLIVQIFELEVMNDINNSWGEKLFELKFDKYEII